jgi:hypothetical protein
MQSNTPRAWSTLGRAMALVAWTGLAACGTEDESVPDSGTDTDVSDAGGDTVSACPGPHPRGCLEEGCPGDGVCVVSDEPGCMPSMCSCDETTGTWGCTADCGPVYACRTPLPNECSTPDPRGCYVLGCPAGESCVPSPLAVCRSSDCFCDSATDSWSCTDDCETPYACVPNQDCNTDADCIETPGTACIYGICQAVQPCNEFNSDIGCENSPFCAWHEPGCVDEGFVPIRGCYPETPCEANADCPAGYACVTEANVEPGCAEDGCAACSQTISLCVPADMAP